VHRRCVVGLAAVLVCGTGCTATTPHHPPASSPAAVAFGTRHVTLGCADSVDATPDQAPREDPFQSLAVGTAPPPRAEDVGLRLPAGMHWYFRKNPLAVPAGAGDVTASVSGPGQVLAWVPGTVWTAGPPPDLGAWAASSLTVRSCPDRTAVFLGGLLAADPTTCVQLTTRRAGQPDDTIRRRLDGSACGG
jgi:hypothetical protein